MKFNQNRRLIGVFYAATASLTLLTGFTSLAAENDLSVDNVVTKEVSKDEMSRQEGEVSWNLTEIVSEVHADAVDETKTAAKEAMAVKELKDQTTKAAQEQAVSAQNIAEQAEAARAAQEAQIEAQAAEQELLAALIFCEAGNQPYEGQVAVGAVVMNRVRSGSFPDTITDVIYQSGQFTPAMTGWLDSVLASDGYTDSAMQAAKDALAGSNPIGDCLYFSTGGGGYQLGDHFFR